ncbi:MAG: RidA family protein [bacterium]|nr:RidA family protein [bacterium]
MVEKKLAELGLQLPGTPKPVATYVPAMKVGDLVYTSGQIPRVDGQMKYLGRVGEQVTVEQGRECAQTCMLNCLAAIKSVVDLDRVVHVVRVAGFVASAPGFTDQPSVVNGASELLIQVFGEKGAHVRVAVGVNELPLNAPVEIELLVRVRE